jgi:hypothetical protein
MTLGWNRVGDDLPPLRAPSAFREGDLSKVGKNQDKGRRLCKAGRLPVAPDWLRRTLAARNGITRLRRLLLTLVLRWLRCTEPYASETTDGPGTMCPIGIATIERVGS